MFLALLLAAPLLAGCGDSSDGGPAGLGGPPGNQTASAVATPSSGTIARGTTTSTTVVYSATGGLVIGSSYTISRQHSGISVDQTSTQTSGSTITKVYAIGADGTVPLGTHEIRFSTPVSGHTGDGPAVLNVVATFILTVTQ